MTTMPNGPWLLVIGCHRSGTSAVTGALVALGLHGVDPSDRIERLPSNPEHWESLSAALFDEDLLAGLGAAWDAPPAPGAEVRLPGPASDGPDPAEVMATAYPEPGPVVWKDPRACLLLPYWRAVLPGPLAAVFVWREPVAVARSLHTRDGIPLAEGLALWEHYNRSAAAGLRGVDTYVLDYTSVIEDPRRALGDVAGWLGGLEQFAPSVGSWDLDAAVAAVDGQLRHESGGESPLDGTLPDDHRGLAEWLAHVHGGHRPFDAVPPEPASPWPEVVLAGRRTLAAAGTYRSYPESEYAEIRPIVEHLLRNREARLAQVRHELDREQLRYEAVRAELDRVLTSTSWKVTRPLRIAIAKLSR